MALTHLCQCVSFVRAPQILPATAASDLIFNRGRRTVVNLVYPFRRAAQANDMGTQST